MCRSSNLKLKCLKCRAQELTVTNCALHRTHTKTWTSSPAESELDIWYIPNWKGFTYFYHLILRCFPESDVYVIFLIDELVWKLVDDILNTWSDRIFSVVCVTNFKVWFCCVIFMSTMVLLGVYVIFLIDKLVWKLVDILNTWSDRIFSVVCVTNFKVWFCCIIFMSTVVLLGVFSGAWFTIIYHASI